MRHNPLGLIAAITAGMAISLSNTSAQMEAPRMPSLSRGKKTKNCTGGRVTQRDLRRRYAAQKGNPRGQYVEIAGRIRNRKKLTGRC